MQNSFDLGLAYLGTLFIQGWDHYNACLSKTLVCVFGESWGGSGSI